MNQPQMNTDYTDKKKTLTTVPSVHICVNLWLISLSLAPGEGRAGDTN